MCSTAISAARSNGGTPGLVSRRRPSWRPNTPRIWLLSYPQRAPRGDVRSALALPYISLHGRFSRKDHSDRYEEGRHPSRQGGRFNVRGAESLPRLRSETNGIGDRPKLHSAVRRPWSGNKKPLNSVPPTRSIYRFP